MIGQVRKVELKSRPDLVVFVRALNAVEDAERGTQVAAAQGTAHVLAEQLLAFACKEDGSPLFANTAAALEWMAKVRSGVVVKIVKEGTKFNELDDEAIEDERKN